MRVIGTLRALVLVGGVLVLTSCGGIPSSGFVITGEYIAVFPEEQQQDELPTNASTVFANSTISLYRTKVGEDGNVEKVEIASKAFRDGNVTFTGHLDGPESIEITAVARDGSQALSTIARVGPGSLTSFALLDYPHPDSVPSDMLVLRGKSLLLKESPSKFTITGNLSTEIGDSRVTTMEIQMGSWDKFGREVYEEIRTLMLDKGSFVYEGEIAEPRVADIEFRGENTFIFVEAVIEPGANISIHPKGSSTQTIATMPPGWFSLDQMSTTEESGRGTIFATAESGRHARLIESWQQSYTFQSTVVAYNVAVQRYQSQQLSAVNPSIDRASTLGTTTLDANLNLPKASSPPAFVAAEGCEHVELSSVVPGSVFTSSPDPEQTELNRLWDEIWAIRHDALVQIARHGIDPMDSLLALELGAFRASPFDEKFEGALEDNINVYDNLGSMLEAEVVARRIEPRRRYIESRLESYRNGRLLTPGQKAPRVVLTNLEKKDVQIYDVFEQSDIVYLQFWEPPIGSWSFSRLKEIYGSYNNLGFQIVTVSTQPDWDVWQTASVSEDIPWLNLGDLSDDAPIGDISRIFGRLYTAKSYLIDNSGCILGSDLSHLELDRYLSEKYGEVDGAN